MSNPVPLVISGPPRSGTTLFSAMLDGHPDINWFPDEGYFFEHLHINRDDIDLFVRAALMGPEFLIEGIKDRGLMPPTDLPLSDFPSLKYNWDHDAFQRVISESRMIRSVKDLWELLRDAYLAGYGYGSRPYVSIKAADYGRSAFGADDNIPIAKIIVLVREPLAMLNSLKAYRRKYGRKFLTWPTLCDAIGQMNWLARELHRRGLRVIRYEDLIASPRKQMQSVCDWLGIPLHSAVLRPTMMGVEWTSNSSFASGESGALHNVTRRWVLSPEEEAYIIECSRPFQDRFNYQSAPQTPSSLLSDRAPVNLSARPRA